MIWRMYLSIKGEIITKKKKEWLLQKITGKITGVEGVQRMPKTKIPSHFMSLLEGDSLD